MEVWTAKTTQPIVRVVRASISQDLRPCRHALTELFRKGGQ